MAEPSMTRDELVALAQKIIDLAGTEEEIDANVALFKDNIVNWSALDLIFWSDDPVTAEEVVERALTPEDE